jgi:hypothetical protein
MIMTITTTRVRQTSRWITIPATLLVVGITVVAFVVSYHALRELAALAGFMASSAAMWPLIVDGIIVLTVVVLFSRRGRSFRHTWTAWVGLIGFTAVSLIGNGLHTAVVYDTGAGLETWVAIAIGAVPPAGLAYAIHLLVEMVTPEPSVSGESPAVTTVASFAPAADVTVTATPSAPAAVARAEPEPVVHELMPDPVAEPVTRPAVHDAEPAVSSEVHGADPEVQPTEPLILTADPDPDPVDQRPAHMTPLTSIKSIPDDLEGQVAWIADRHRAGHDVTPKTLTHLFEEAGQPMSSSTLKRRIAAARELVAA